MLAHLSGNSPCSTNALWLAIGGRKTTFLDLLSSMEERGLVEKRAGGRGAWLWYAKPKQLPEGVSEEAVAEALEGVEDDED